VDVCCTAGEFKDTRRLMQRLDAADALIGVHGAGLAQAAFIPPRALLVELKVPVRHGAAS
jgi:hypothetical protein